MRKSLTTIMVIGLTVGLLAVSNAHFVGTPTISTTGDTAFFTGKVAGLGNVEEITVTVTGDAQCVNPGSQKPQAGNKQTFTGTENVPVQNGKATFSLSLDATFSPDCAPPMTVVWSNLSITVTAVDGTFLTYP